MTSPPPRGLIADDIRAACGGAAQLLGPAARGPEDLAAYLRSGGYQPAPAPAQIIAAAEQAGLDGRGGAGFPLAQKLRAVAAGAGRAVAVANGEEGEPASVKDRWLLRHRPHLVLDGLRLAATALDADDLFVYVSDPAAAAVLRNAITELAGLTDWQVPLPTLVEVDPTYVAGEETSVVRAIDGGEAKPTLKPPRPYEVGVDRRPTLVSNVESLARLATSLDPDIRTAAGQSLLLTVVDGAGASLLEAPPTASVGEVFAARRGPAAPAPIAVLMGGFAGGIWGPEMLAATLDRRELRSAGTLLGCGSLIAVEPGDCPVAAATDVVRYLAAQSSGQCGICVRGSAVVAEDLISVALGTAPDTKLADLTRRVSMMVGRGNCALPDAVEVMVRTLLQNFSAEVEAHLVTPCPVCLDQVGTSQPDTRFRVALALPRPSPAESSMPAHAGACTLEPPTGRSTTTVKEKTR